MPTVEGSILKVVIEGVLDAQRCLMVFHFRDDVGGFTEQQVEDEMNNNLLSRIAEHTSQDVLFTMISVQELWPEAKDPYQEVKAFNGQVAEAALPTVLAGVVSMRTGLAGRSNRGRKYFYGIPQSEVADSQLSQDYLLLVANKWAALHDRYKPGSALAPYTWGVLHKKLGGQPVPIGANSFTAANSVVARPYVATMRSRRPGHGM